MSCALPQFCDFSCHITSYKHTLIEQTSPWQYQRRPVPWVPTYRLDLGLIVIGEGLTDLLGLRLTCLRHAVLPLGLDHAAPALPVAARQHAAVVFAGKVHCKRLQQESMCWTSWVLCKCLIISQLTLSADKWNAALTRSVPKLLFVRLDQSLMLHCLELDFYLWSVI